MSLSGLEVHPYSSLLLRTSTVDNAMSKLASSAVKEYHILIWKSILHFQRRWQNKGDIWQRHGEHYTDACIMEIDSWEDHTSWCGNFKFEPVISQIIHRPRQRYWGYGSSLHRPSSETPTWSHFLHTIGTILSSMTTPMFNLKEPQEIFFSKTT
jgi:hypothetical protein